MQRAHDISRYVGHLSGGERAAGLSKAIGQEVRYADVSPEVYRSSDFPGADHVGNMFQFKRDFNVFGARPGDHAQAEFFPAYIRLVAGSVRVANSDRLIPETS